MIALTGRARARLQQYLLEVRAGLSRSDLDIEEVVEGLQEHVDARLRARNEDGPISLDALERVLEQLGDPVEIAEEPAPPRSTTWRWGPPTALLLVVVGAALVVGPQTWAPVGWVVLGGALCLVRALVRPDRMESGDPLAGMLRGVWAVASSLSVAAALLVVGALTWGLAQTGGPLHGLNPGVSEVLWAVTLGALATGLWWLLLGLLGPRLLRPVRRALGPTAHWLPARPRAALIAMGLVMVVLAIPGLLR